MPGLQRNIELKARCPDLPAARAACGTLQLRGELFLRQIDTYFNCEHGRLKLRVIDDGKAELIWYDRCDEAISRASDYRVVPVSNANELREALNAAIGIRVEVRKRRRVLLWHNVRIHLDEVEGLGSFVEFEAVMDDGSDEATAHARLAELCRLLSIAPVDYLKDSYENLMLAQSADDESKQVNR
jgi:predicted adenylyl cyclase CyaB